MPFPASGSRMNATDRSQQPEPGSLTVRPAAFTRTRPVRRVSDLVQHFEGHAKTYDAGGPSAAPHAPRPAARRSLPTSADSPYAASGPSIPRFKAQPAPALAIAAKARREVPTADGMAKQTQTHDSESRTTDILGDRSPIRPASPPAIQRGALGGMDWTERPRPPEPRPSVAQARIPEPIQRADPVAHTSDHEPSHSVSPRTEGEATAPETTPRGEDGSSEPSVVSTPRVYPASERKDSGIMRHTRDAPQGLPVIETTPSTHVVPVVGLPGTGSGLPFSVETAMYSPESRDHDLARDADTAYSHDADDDEDANGGKTLRTADDQPLLSAADDADSLKEPAGVQEVKPLPARAVFSRTSPPLHLPVLDRLLADRRYFPPPHFGFSEVSSSPGELALCRVGGSTSDDEKKDEKASSILGSSILSVSGRQLQIPASNVIAEAKVSKRKRWKRPQERGRGAFRRITDNDEDDTEDAKPPVASDSASQVTLHDDVELEHLSSKAPSSSRPSANSGYLPSFSDGAASALSTDSKPLTRNSMFAPLMLLKTSSLNELKTNAVGPRAPPGGPFSWLPGLSAFLGTILDLLIGVEGSSFAASIFQLELFRDFAQMMRLNLSWQSAADPNASKLHKIFFETIPSILALDFVSVFGLAIVFFVLWIVLTGLGLLWFWHMTSSYDANRSIQGYEGQPYIFSSPKRGTKVTNIVVTFVLTSLYIPLSKIAFDALLWSSDFWVVVDPYQGGAINDPHPASLGDPAIFRGPMDFCYTTTMRKDEFNWAWFIVPVAFTCIVVYTILWPIYLVRVIRTMCPSVSEYNELGKKRNAEDMDSAYGRQLDHDKSPLNFLYNAYNRHHAAYKPFYILFFKLSALLVITFFTKENCVWRQVQSRPMLLSQQSILIGLQIVLLGLHLWTRPFRDTISNRAELTARVAYVFTALIGLLVVLRVPGAHIYDSVVMYVLQGFSYGSSVYFGLVSTNVVGHWIRRVQQRLDFSIDIYSPALDMQKHIKRRIWEETLSILLLAGDEYRMPLGTGVNFSNNTGWPPYLLFFKGTAAERHVENLKILKDIGLAEYKKQVERLRGPEGERIRRAMDTIQRLYAGPDAYYRPIRPPFPQGVSNFFGKAFMAPFPPTLVIRYDQQGLQTMELTELDEFEAFIAQNASEEVQSRKMVRVSLRALDKHVVWCPYTSTEPRRRSVLHKLLPDRSRTTFTLPIVYREGVLHVKVKPFSEWQGYNFSSGFEVSIDYASGERLDPEGATHVRQPISVSASQAFGLHDDFLLTTATAAFLQANEVPLRQRVPQMESLLEQYRSHFHSEAVRKRETLTYDFLTDIFDAVELWDAPPEKLHAAFHAASLLPAVQTLPQRYPASIHGLYERLAAVRRSPVHTFWYLWWDDLWRQNGRDYAPMQRHRKAFDPRYPTSIAYRPLPRKALEVYLAERGMWDTGRASGFWGGAWRCWSAESRAGSGLARVAQERRAGTKGPINRGTLNRLYFTLNRLAFGSSGHRHDCSCEQEKTDEPSSSPAQGPDSVLKPAPDPSLIIEVGQRNKDAPASHISAHNPSSLDGSRHRSHHHHHHHHDVHSGPTDPNSGTAPHSHLTTSTALTVRTNETGGGTDASRSTIPDRHAWRWEQRLAGSGPHAADASAGGGGLGGLRGMCRAVVRRAWEGAMEFLALTPYRARGDLEGLWVFVVRAEGQCVRDGSGAEQCVPRLELPKQAAAEGQTEGHAGDEGECDCGYGRH